MQNDGRAETFMARSNISQLIAAGIATQRSSKPAGPGRHHTMAAATNIQQTICSRVFTRVSLGQVFSIDRVPVALDARAFVLKMRFDPGVLDSLANRGNAIRVSGSVELCVNVSGINRL